MYRRSPVRNRVVVQRRGQDRCKYYIAASPGFPVMGNWTYQLGTWEQEEARIGYIPLCYF